MTTSNQTIKPSNNNVLVFYHYFEANEQYRDNFVFFLSNAYREDLDFIIIIADECSISLPQASNIAYIQTANMNLDYGGYGFALTQTQINIEQYDFFIFINSSVRGPFLPSYVSNRWCDPFIHLLQGKTHLVGSSINVLSSLHNLSINYLNKYHGTPPLAHVQTTSYGMTRTALQYLLSIGFYDQEKIENKDDIVIKYEIRLSQVIKEKGWGITCLLPEYNKINYLDNPKDPNPTTYFGDLLNQRAYFGRTVHAYELLFIKTNRNLISTFELESLSFSSLNARTPNHLILNWQDYQSFKQKNLMQLTLGMQANKSFKSRMKFKIIKKASQWL